MVIAKHSLVLNNIIDTAVFEVTDTACLLWKYMDDAHVVYDPRSGYSQAMNDFAREILAIFEERPCNLTDIMAELEKVMESSLDDDLRQKIRETVIAFDEMGLIMPVKVSTNQTTPCE